MLDVVIIGAGAAGLAAAGHLRAAELDVPVLEASPHLGGRARTLVAHDMPLDLGCGWLHSADRNVWAKCADAMGFHIDRTPPHCERQSGGQDFSKADQSEFRAELNALFERLEHADPNAPDRPASTLMKSPSRWNPLLDAVSCYYNGVEWSGVSIHDFRAYQDTNLNWRVREGYGALVQAYGHDLPVQCNCPVELLEWGAQVRAVTPRGTIEAAHAIIAVPTTVLAKERLRLDPPLLDKLEAAHDLPLGAVEKVFLALAEPDLLPAEGHLFGRIDQADTGSYHLRPFGRPVIECFFGGALACALDGEPEGAFADFAIAEMTHLLGSHASAVLDPIAQSHWLAAPFIGGAYSHARPGHADARQILARPVGDRLFFAGEACSPASFSTAHGAFESGVAAAKALLALRARG